jgi:hypothetical protein
MGDLCVYVAQVVKNKRNVVCVHAMKAYSYRGSGGIALLSLNVPRSGMSSQIHVPDRLPPRKGPSVPIH